MPESVEAQAFEGPTEVLADPIPEPEPFTDAEYAASFKMELESQPTEQKDEIPRTSSIIPGQGALFFLRLCPNVDVFL